MGQRLQQLLMDHPIVTNKALKEDQEAASKDRLALQETLQFLEEHSPFMRWLERLHIKSVYHSHQDLILQALTHSSFAHEIKDWAFGHNERLEFLGDAVLDWELSHQLWEKFPDLNEGELSRFRSSLVNEDTLAQWALALELQDFILLGRGESKKEVVEPAILADGLEALLGAVSLANRKRPSEILPQWIELFNKSCKEGEPHFFDRVRLNLFDPKTRLQEMTLEGHKVTPNYHCEEDGENFRCHVSLNDKILGSGMGTSKKKAEIAAARNALLTKPFNQLENYKSENNKES